MLCSAIPNTPLCCANTALACSRPSTSPCLRTRQSGHHQPIAVSNSPMPARYKLALTSLSCSACDKFGKHNEIFLRATLTLLFASAPNSTPAPRPSTRITGNGNQVTMYRRLILIQTGQNFGPKNANLNLGGVIATDKSAESYLMVSVLP